MKKGPQTSALTALLKEDLKYFKIISIGIVMFAFIVRRIIQAVMVMLVISLVGFSIQNQIGDPVRDLVGERVTPAEREVIRNQLGLNDPFYVQYARFVKKACQGDLGLSFFYKKPALEVIVAKAPATIELVLVTAIIIIFFSIPAGIYSAINPKAWFSRIVMAVSTVVYASSFLRHSFFQT